MIEHQVAPTSKKSIDVGDFHLDLGDGRNLQNLRLLKQKGLEKKIVTVEIESVKKKENNITAKHKNNEKRTGYLTLCIRNIFVHKAVNYEMQSYYETLLDVLNDAMHSNE